MKNKAIDFHNMLFEQLEVLNDDELEGEALEKKMKRIDLMCKVAVQINKNNSNMLNATKLRLENPDIEFPDMLQAKPKMIEAPRIKK
jgi:hypothetical protein